jgi:hypothetical protein
MSTPTDRYPRPGGRGSPPRVVRREGRRSRSRSRERRRSRSRSRQRRRPNTNRLSRSERGRNTTARRREVSPAPSRFRPTRPSEFAPDNVFTIVGHGVEESLVRHYRYALKLDEFYFTSVRCGLLAFLPFDKIYKFMTSHPHIHIPTKLNSTYININSRTLSTMDVKTSVSKNIPGTPSDRYKMYVPFSTSTATRTIPYTNVSLFSYWRVKNAVVPPTFTFAGHAYSTTGVKADEFAVYTIGISGILTPNHSSIKYRDAIAPLLPQSAAVLETFGVPVTQMEKDHLYACLPRSSHSLPLRADPPDPLTAHFKAVIDAVYADSLIKPTDINPDMTYGMLWNSYSLANIYIFIKSKRTTPGPILLINNMCRVYKGPSENLVGYNSNANASPRGTRNLKALSAAAGTPSDA